MASVTTYFVYSDIDGQMLGEYTATGTPIREYIYLEGERVAMYDYTGVEPKDSTNNKAIVYLHNDHIGQTHIGMNSDGQFIYERVQTPFGETMSEMNVYNVQVPVRFPGQYYDSESGFSQNWNRDYDSSLGRYVQSDPIGLRGGTNTFGYVGQNPVMMIDPLGLYVAWNPNGWCQELHADGSQTWWPCDQPPPDDCPVGQPPSFGSPNSPSPASSSPVQSSTGGAGTGGVHSGGSGKNGGGSECVEYPGHPCLSYSDTCMSNLTLSIITGGMKDALLVTASDYVPLTDGERSLWKGGFKCVLGPVGIVLNLNDAYHCYY